MGMIVGAAAAAIDNGLCESKMREQGYMNTDDVGKSGLTFEGEASAEAVVVASVSPADQCLKQGDKIVEIDRRSVANVKEAKEAFFKESGTKIIVKLDRQRNQVECEFTLL